MAANIDDILATQRKFIHDIASPISIIQGMLEIVLSQLKEKNIVDNSIIEKLEKVSKASDKIVNILQVNRTYLMDQRPDPSISKID